MSRRTSAAEPAGWGGLRAALDGWDVLIVLSALMTFAGLALTFSVGIALVVMGVLGMLAGVAGARGAELASVMPSGRRGD
ncbi:hypothetical protein H0B56_12140 [Haloechinothrix sp. YIM 98757]|uniref:Uncharacterized protein n=1 Tax=Haloechinothrix aidingensis TaxID=2752311 RepID=A0A838AAM1_9PSEU|nr:hypothetical protein [Haloechinothrix aidingensis]MBA0126292.1 hypothetical protein [Haloechinothrix aidingensis]